MNASVHVGGCMDVCVWWQGVHRLWAGGCVWGVHEECAQGGCPGLASGRGAGLVEGGLSPGRPGLLQWQELGCADRYTPNAAVGYSHGGVLPCAAAS